MTRVINSGMRLVCRLRKRDHISEHLKRHRVLTMRNRIKLRLLTLIRKVLITGMPGYLRDLVEEYVPGRNLRSVDQGLLKKQRAKTKNGTRSFRVLVPELWNELTKSIRECKSYTFFRNEVENFLLMDVDCQIS